MLTDRELQTMRNLGGFSEEAADKIDYLSDRVQMLVSELSKTHTEIDRLKTVPMKYRRMAFNAQLQEENKDLQDRLARMGRVLKTRTQQRDKAKGRANELHGYVTKYQREIADLKKFIRNMKDPS